DDLRPRIKPTSGCLVGLQRAVEGAELGHEAHDLARVAATLDVEEHDSARFRIEEARNAGKGPTLRLLAADQLRLGVRFGRAAEPGKLAQQKRKAPLVLAVLCDGQELAQRRGGNDSDHRLSPPIGKSRLETFCAQNLGRLSDRGLTWLTLQMTGQLR